MTTSNHDTYSYEDEVTDPYFLPYLAGIISHSNSGVAAVSVQTLNTFRSAELFATEAATELASKIPDEMPQEDPDVRHGLETAGVSAEEKWLTSTSKVLEESDAAGEYKKKLNNTQQSLRYWIKQAQDVSININKLNNNHLVPSAQPQPQTPNPNPYHLQFVATKLPVMNTINTINNETATLLKKIRWHINKASQLGIDAPGLEASAPSKTKTR